LRGGRRCSGGQGCHAAQKANPHFGRR
jgi:hypothetical protein